MSWVWPEYVDRELPLTRSERKAIHRDACRLWWANRWNIALYLTLPAFYLLAVPFASDVGGGVATFVGAGGLIHKLFRPACGGGELLRWRRRPAALPFRAVCLPSDPPTRLRRVR